MASSLDASQGALRAIDVSQALNSIKRTIKLSCLDASLHYLVIGAQTGSIYFFERSTLKFVQLVSFDDMIDPITWLSFSPDERLLAFATGSTSKKIYITPIPVKSRRKKDLICISDHKAEVRCLEWAQMPSGGSLQLALFSADDSGIVCKTLAGLASFPSGSSSGSLNTPSSTTELLYQADSRVTQLSYEKETNQLIVSSTTCTALLDFSKAQAVKIGTKPRQGNYGASFYMQVEGASSASAPETSLAGFNTQLTPVILASRPGNRIWVAKPDNPAKVVQTLNFQSSLTSSIPSFLFGSQSLFKDLKTSIEDLNFYKLIPMENIALLTFNASTIFVLDISNLKILSWYFLGNKIHGSIADVAVRDSHAYILYHRNESEAGVAAGDLSKSSDALSSASLTTPHLAQLSIDFSIFLSSCLASQDWVRSSHMLQRYHIDNIPLLQSIEPFMLERSVDRNTVNELGRLAQSQLDRLAKLAEEQERKAAQQQQPKGAKATSSASSAPVAPTTATANTVPAPQQVEDVPAMKPVNTDWSSFEVLPASASISSPSSPHPQNQPHQTVLGTEDAAVSNPSAPSSLPPSQPISSSSSMAELPPFPFTKDDYDDDVTTTTITTVATAGVPQQGTAQQLEQLEDSQADETSPPAATTTTLPLAIPTPSHGNLNGNDSISAVAAGVGGSMLSPSFPSSPSSSPFSSAPPSQPSSIHDPFNFDSTSAPPSTVATNPANEVSSQTTAAASPAPSPVPTAAIEAHLDASLTAANVSQSSISSTTSSGVARRKKKPKAVDIASPSAKPPNAISSSTGSLPSLSPLNTGGHHAGGGHQGFSPSSAASPPPLGSNVLHRSSPPPSNVGSGSSTTSAQMMWGSESAGDSFQHQGAPQPSSGLSNASSTTGSIPLNHSTSSAPNPARHAGSGGLVHSHSGSSLLSSSPSLTSLTSGSTTLNSSIDSSSETVPGASGPGIAAAGDKTPAHPTTSQTPPIPITTAELKQLGRDFKNKAKEGFKSFLSALPTSSSKDSSSSSSSSTPAPPTPASTASPGINPHGQPHSASSGGIAGTQTPGNPPAALAPVSGPITSVQSDAVTRRAVDRLQLYRVMSKGREAMTSAWIYPTLKNWISHFHSSLESLSGASQHLLVIDLFTACFEMEVSSPKHEQPETWQEDDAKRFLELYLPSVRVSEVMTLTNIKQWSGVLDYIVERQNTEYESWKGDQENSTIKGATLARFNDRLAIDHLVEERKDYAGAVSKVMMKKDLAVVMPYLKTLFFRAPKEVISSSAANYPLLRPHNVLPLLKTWNHVSSAKTEEEFTKLMAEMGQTSQVTFAEIFPLLQGLPQLDHLYFNALMDRHEEPRKDSELVRAWFETTLKQELSVQRSSLFRPSPSSSFPVSISPSGNRAYAFIPHQQLLQKDATGSTEPAFVIPKTYPSSFPSPSSSPSISGQHDSSSSSSNTANLPLKLYVLFSALKDASSFNTRPSTPLLSLCMQYGFFQGAMRLLTERQDYEDALELAIDVDDASYFQHILSLPGAISPSLWPRILQRVAARIYLEHLEKSRTDEAHEEQSSLALTVQQPTKHITAYNITPDVLVGLMSMSIGALETVQRLSTSQEDDPAPVSKATQSKHGHKRESSSQRRGESHPVRFGEISDGEKEESPEKDVNTKAQRQASHLLSQQSMAHFLSLLSPQCFQQLLLDGARQEEKRELVSRSLKAFDQSLWAKKSLFFGPQIANVEFIEKASAGAAENPLRHVGFFHTTETARGLEWNPTFVHPTDMHGSKAGQDGIKELTSTGSVGGLAGSSSISAGLSLTSTSLSASSTSIAGPASTPTSFLGEYGNHWGVHTHFTSDSLCIRCGLPLLDPRAGKIAIFDHCHHSYHETCVEEEACPECLLDNVQTLLPLVLPSSTTTATATLL